MTAGFQEQEFSLEKRSDQQAGLLWGMAGWLGTRDSQAWKACNSQTVIRETHRVSGLLL